MSNLQKTESVRISSSSMDIARMIKKATGISIAAFIDQSIETAYSRQTKAVKAKIQYNNLKN